MTVAPPRDRGGVAAPVTMSAVLHAIILTAFVMMRPAPAPPSPPIYRVNLVAAPPGERAIGVVQPRAATPPPATKAPTPPRPVTSVPDAAPAPAKPRREPPRRAPTQATPTPEAAQPPPRAKPETAAPAAGGGPVGGRGADVATVRTEGIEFPYPGYLQNIVRQIALRFKPNPRWGTRRAEVMFLIHRDGTISNLNFRVPSGSYAFDVEARGAVESAAEARAFGPLPRGFQDDVLPVIFSFDPRLIR
ncbi:MAG: TonB C-terminal domain-containing protein [Gemmatimonadaceae bacterium]